MKFLVLFFILSYNVFSLAKEDCSTKNLLEEPVLKDRININQKDSNWCYAYAAADALTLLFKQPVSAMDLAIQYNADKKNSMKELLEGGITSELGTVVNKYGICPESEFMPPIRGWNETLYQINYFKNNPSKCSGEEFDNLWKPNFYKNLTNISEIRAVLLDQSNKSTPDALQQLANLNCKDKRYKSELKIKSEHKNFKIGWDDQEELHKLKKYLDDSLDQEKVSVLLVDTTQYLNKKLGFFEKVKSQFQGTHSVSLLGRKKVGNQCIYTIRDSTLICALVKKGLICDEKIDNTVEIPEEILLRSIKGSTQFEFAQ